MTKFLWLVAIVCLVLTACSTPKAEKEKEPIGITWTKDVPAKHDIINGAAITYNDEIYVLAGKDGRFMKYNPANYTWIDLAGVPAPRTEPAMTLWKDRVVVAGGVDDSSHFMRRVDYYDLTLNAWKAMASLPEGRCRFSLNVMDDILYATMGVCGVDEQFYTNCKDILFYNDSAKTWQNQASLSSGRYGNASAIYNSTLYAIGGYSADPKLGTFYVNHRKKEVGAKPSIPNSRGNFGAVTVGDFILTFGGKTQGNFSPSEKLDILNSKWTELEPCPFWTDRFAYTRWKNTIYVFGGSQFPQQVWKGEIKF